MDELVALGIALGVFLCCEPSETLLEDVDAQRFDARYADVNAQVKLVSVDQEWILNVARYNGQFVNIDFADVVDNINAATTGQIGWLHDPKVVLRILLPQLLKVVVKVSKLVRYHVGVGKEIEGGLAEPVLHLGHV